MSAGPFADRLRKNARHLHKWGKTRGLTAYRLYDRDMPEYPYAVDWYAGRVQLIAYAGRRTSDPVVQTEVLQAVLDVLEVPQERVFLKSREPKAWGREQYQRLSAESAPFVVEEQGLRFWVDLSAHLDTGLFLDHRLTRARVREEAAGKSFLNLFAYTGSFTVYAAAGKARQTTSVDLSNTYLDWAQRNLTLNGLDRPQHRLIRADARTWLKQARREFDLVVLDPPSFSSSKGMRGTLDIQRDHPRLLREALAVVAPGGALYFSTPFQGFHLSREAEGLGDFEELTPRSIPEDFRHQNVHRCWRIVPRPS
jgi:23S rRNA (cytosine1962-C5)-methyltransferase